MRGEYRRDLDGQDKGMLDRAGPARGRRLRAAPSRARVVFQDARLWDLGRDERLLDGPRAARGHRRARGVGRGAHGRRTPQLPPRRAAGHHLGRGASARAPRDWSPTGRTLDAVRGRLVTGDWGFELLAAILEDPWAPFAATSATNAYGVAPAYGELFGARAEWSLAPLFAVDAYGLARVAQSNPLASLAGSVRGETYTGALRLHGDAHGWTWGAEGAYQLGHADSITGPNAAVIAPTYAATRAAWATAGHVTYAFEHVALSPDGAPRRAPTRAATRAAAPRTAPSIRSCPTCTPGTARWTSSPGPTSSRPAPASRPSRGPTRVAAVEYRYARLAEPAGALDERRT